MKDGPKPFRLLGEDLVLFPAEEMPMPSDRPGMLMRQRLNALLEANGERGVPR
jgi:hypothetical protein